MPTTNRAAETTPTRAVRRRLLIRLSSPQPVTGTGNCGEWKVRSQFASELTHMDVDSAFVSNPVGLPSSVKDLPSA
jgi:ribosomal protein L32